jgi:hypothetical protein
MKVRVRRARSAAPALRIFSLSLVLAAYCGGQEATAPGQNLISEGCPKDADFEHYMGTNSPYFVRSSKVENPFDFLPWVHAQDIAVAEDIARLVDQKPFSYANVRAKALDMLNAQDMLPEATQVRFRLRVDLLEVSCFRSTPNVDVVYHVYTAQVAPAAAGTVEGQKEAEQTPQSASGLTQGSSRSFLPSNLVPLIGFDSSDKLYSGGRLTVPLCGYREKAGVSSSAAAPASSNCPLPLQLLLEGQGSQTMESLHAALRLSKDSLGPILHSAYLMNYNLLSTPTGAGQIRRAMGSLQYSGTSKPFFGGNVNARFGLLVAKGDQQSQLHVAVPPGDLAASALNALKLYGGLDSRLPHNVLSASMGLELGTTDVASGVQWKKYVGDLRHDFWFNVGSGYPIDLESRLTAGAIQASGPMPVAERFFGGNYEQLFMPDDSWQIRANPVIRAIPGSRFFETGVGAGGDRFVAANFTAAFAVWRKPLVPDEVRNDPTFLQLLNGQIVSATSIDQLHYTTSDPHYQAIVAELQALLDALGGLGSAVDAAQRAHPDEFATQFKACSSAVKMASNRAKSAMASSDAKRYGLIAALLPVDEDRLNKAIQKCSDLTAVLTSGSDINLDPLKMEQKRIQDEFAAIDQNAAAAKAKADMAFVRRTLNTLFKEVNLASISPVAVFDIARIGPSGPGVNGTRYGPGGGLRLEIASAVHFTIGYARNVNAGPGEGSGAIFFSMGVRDLFH